MLLACLTDTHRIFDSDVDCSSQTENQVTMRLAHDADRGWRYSLTRPCEQVVSIHSHDRH